MVRSLYIVCCLSCSFSVFGQIDQQATCETVSLYRNLKLLCTETILFGHQNSNYEGIGWKDYHGRGFKSDVEKAVGDFPAVFGYDFIDGYYTFLPHIKKAHATGGIITMSHHIDNPLTGEDSWSNGNGAVSEILNIGSDAHQRYLNELNQAASFFNQVTDSGGNLIPIIYRPFHENSGSWFWWGKNHCTAEEFVALWQLTVDYLKNEKGVHNVLYAYSPSTPVSKGGYDDRYPGDDYVDIVGFDIYRMGTMGAELVENARFVVKFANQRHKIAALTEFGCRNGIHNSGNADWFVSEVLTPLQNDPIAQRLAYIHTWRNESATHHWVPLQDDLTYDSFYDLYENDLTSFLSDVPSDLYDCKNWQPEELTYVPLDFAIYPNPSTAIITIKLPEHIRPVSEYQIYIYNNLGQLILSLQATTHQQQIEIHNFENGLYTIQVICDGQLFGGMFFKN